MTSGDGARLNAYRSVAEQAAREFRTMIASVLADDAISGSERRRLNSAYEDINDAVLSIRAAGKTIRSINAAS